MTTIRTPVPGWTGTFNGDHFIDGVCEAATESNLAYYRRHGYLIEEATEEATNESPKRARRPQAVVE